MIVCACWNIYTCLPSALPDDWTTSNGSQMLHNLMWQMACTCQSISLYGNTECFSQKQDEVIKEKGDSHFYLYLFSPGD